jgi:hypothetical protein
MDALGWTLLIVGIIVVVGLVYLALRARKTHGLRERFGPEYERTLDRSAGRRAAEADLAARRERIDQLHLTPLTAPDRDRLTSQWTKVQAAFVDRPGDAVSDADQLIQQVMEKRGYPVEDFDRRAADLSVEHPTVVESYRTAHSIAVKESRDDGDANTEALRKAMVHYRTLFDELLVVESDSSRPTNN